MTQYYQDNKEEITVLPRARGDDFCYITGTVAYPGSSPRAEMTPASETEAVLLEVSKLEEVVAFKRTSFTSA